MSSKKLSQIIKALFYCLAAAPLFFTPQTTYPFIFGRAILMQIIIEVAVASYVALAIADKNWRPNKNMFLVVGGVFLGWLLLSSVFGADISRSFWGTTERMDGWVFIAHAFAAAAIASAIFQSKAEWRRFLGFNVIVGLIVFVVALPSAWGAKFMGFDFGMRISGTMGNAIFLATYLTLMLAAALYLAFSFSGRWRYFYFLSAAALTMGIFLTRGRGSFLGLLAGAVAALVYVGFSGNKKQRLLTSAAVLLLVAAPIALSLMHNLSFVKKSQFLNRISNLSLASGETRLISWRIAGKSFFEKPVMGLGVDNFYVAFNKLYEPALLRYSYYETWSDKPHNKFLEVASEAGAVGLAAYLSLYGGAFFALRRRKKSGEFSTAEAAVLIGGLVAYAGGLFFAFDTGVSYFFFFLLLAFLAGRFNGASQENRPVKSLTIVVAAVAILPIAWFCGFSPVLANMSLRSSTLPTEVGGKADIGAFKKGMAYWNPYQDEWRADLAKSVVSALRGKRAAYNGEEVDCVLQETEKTVLAHLNDAYYHMLLGGFYAELGERDEKYFSLAEKELQKALQLSPNRQHIYFGLGRLYNLWGKRTEMMRVFETAINSDPEVAVSYWEAGKQAYLFDEKDPLAKKWLEAAVSRGYAPSDREEILFIFKNTYEDFLANKDYNALVALYGAMITIEPAEAKWPAQLAMALYLAGGDKTMIIYRIRQAIALDESYRADGEAFIRQVEASNQ
jgi:O-antigen ligase